MPATNDPGSVPPFILASASARRSDLLQSAGIAFEVFVPKIDEIPHPREAPRAFALRMAREKARAVATRRRNEGDQRPVLAADTIVVATGQTLGKPRDRADAQRMVELLANRTHHVTTAFALDTATGIHTGHATTEVEFRELTPAEIHAYLDRASWHDKAGAYAIQGEAAAMVRRISGSHSNVIGLPLAEVVTLLRDRGIIGEDATWKA